MLAVFKASWGQAGQACCWLAASQCCAHLGKHPLPCLQMEGPCLVALTDGTAAQSHIPTGDFR